MQMISGADIALWDIAGKACGQPVWALLGGRYRQRVKAYASTLFRPTPDGMRQAVEEYLQQGFRVIKFGWGVFGDDPGLDLALVRAARQAAGPGVDLMVDAGWYGTGYDWPYRTRPLKAWISLVRPLEELGVLWLEDFLHPDNLDGYARVAEHTTTLRLAAGLLGALSLFLRPTAALLVLPLPFFSAGGKRGAAWTAAGLGAGVLAFGAAKSPAEKRRIRLIAPPLLRLPDG